MSGVAITKNIDHEMTYRECDIGNGLRPSGTYSLIVVVEDVHGLDGTFHVLHFTVAGAIGVNFIFVT
jgi:hypothetical protein